MFGDVAFFDAHVGRGRDVEGVVFCPAGERGVGMFAGEGLFGENERRLDGRALRLSTTAP